ncbi:MAG: serine hydrolase [Acutalibacteraceae bacterium]
MKQRILSLLLAVSLLLSAGFTGTVLPVSAQTAVIKGDVNKDGAINTADVRLILRCTLEIDACSAETLFAADFNGDGALTSSDARMVLTYAINPHDNTVCLDSGVCSLTLKGTQSAVNVYDFRTEDGTNIDSCSYADNAAQKLYLMNTGNGVVFWTMCTAGSVLTVGSSRNVVQSAAVSNPATQKWYLQQADGGYVIRSFVYGTALTMAADGNICVSDYQAGNENQIWNITPQSSSIRYAVSTVSLNCRAGASTSYDTYGAIAEGATVVVTGEAVNGWYPVIAFEETSGELMCGYASGTYLSFFRPQRTFVEGEDEPAPTVDISDELYALISRYVSDNAASDAWSVYVQPLTGEADNGVLYNNADGGAMVSASLIKLWTMGAVYEQASLENVTLTDTVNNNLHQMIIVSSNEANNTLVQTTLGGGSAQTGFEKVNRFASSIGCSDTVMNRLMLVSDGTQNWTSVTDCAAFLRQCYYGELPYSSEMLGHLKEQEVDTKITASNGITAAVDIAHKTGELSGLAEHDVGIVFDSQAGGVDFILCIMTDPTSNSNSRTDTLIASLSKQIYDLMHSAYAL